MDHPRFRPDQVEHLTAELLRTLPAIHARLAAIPDDIAANDGMRSPSLGGARPVGSHSDPTPSAALRRADPADPSVMRKAQRADEARLMDALLSMQARAIRLNLAYAPMPTCGCGRSVPRSAMKGAVCAACARAAQRRNQRALVAVRVERGVAS